jgi:hypothetical protein
VLDATEPTGRRLDFPMQELEREANTLYSNSQDDETRRHAPPWTCAVPIEQMREEVQNVAWPTVLSLQGEDFTYSGPRAAALPQTRKKEVVHGARKKE